MEYKTNENMLFDTVNSFVSTYKTKVRFNLTNIELIILLVIYKRKLFFGGNTPANLPNISNLLHKQNKYIQDELRYLHVNKYVTRNKKTWSYYSYQTTDKAKLIINEYIKEYKNIKLF